MGELVARTILAAHPLATGRAGAAHDAAPSRGGVPPRGRRRSRPTLRSLILALAKLKKFAGIPAKPCKFYPVIRDDSRVRSTAWEFFTDDESDDRGVQQPYRE